MSASVVVWADTIGMSDGIEALRSSVTIARQCDDLLETIALVESGLADAAVLAGPSPDVDAHVIDGLRERGAAVLVLVDDAAERRRLEELGAVCESAMSTPQAIADLLELTLAALPRHQPTAVPAVDHPTHPPEPSATRGQVVAVWGPVGSPGRTTVAVNYAVESALAGARVALLDADTYGASVSAYLGLMEESAGMAQLCRLSDQGVLDRSGYERACPLLHVSGVRLRVATGLPRPHRWPELRKASLERVLDYLRTVVDLVVIDVAAPLELDEELSFDTAAPQRNAASAVVVEQADEVIAVGQADAIGVPRLIKALEQLEEVSPGSVPRVVFNKVRRESVGTHPERQLRQTWDRFGPAAPIRGYLPWEPETTAEALLAGTALAECAPNSSLRIAIAQLAGHDVVPRRSLFAPRRGARVTGS
ncbi:AAA family ATPase [Zhihengliuella flava]|uniref:Mrp family chromosome partitioning ATPase n=1 Tax=Zhihengliuella flava TaxID=1285193 RepID=A0A931DDS9_9MICC|nr:P-loop NTPase [Zhihengliuella flava]MBG6085616.1 Mrp family chromosome partitioning ATPase [Zhihengliuella flava]